ncbi:MAG: HDOD domain-containing protein [Myxococcales bacterium]
MAFLCGLLHDLGEAIILSVCAEQEKLLGVQRLPTEVSTELVTRYHEQVGLLACEVWRLPESICDAVAHHHHPEQSSHPANMARVVAVTDRLMEHVGLGSAPRPLAPGQEPLFDQMGLAPEQVARLAAFVEKLVKEGDPQGDA